MWPFPTNTKERHEETELDWCKTRPCWQFTFQRLCNRKLELCCPGCFSQEIQRVFSGMHTTNSIGMCLRAHIVARAVGGFNCFAPWATLTCKKSHDSTTALKIPHCPILVPCCPYMFQACLAKRSKHSDHQSRLDVGTPGTPNTNQLLASFSSYSTTRGAICHP